MPNEYESCQSICIYMALGMFGKCLKKIYPVYKNNIKAMFLIVLMFVIIIQTHKNI